MQPEPRIDNRLTPNLTTDYASRSMPRTALIVAATPELLAMISAALTGWNVEQASDNRIALTMVEKRSFGLIVTGEASSGKADVELLRKIRRVRPHTRLIILTNKGTPADVIASMRERAFSYFSMPFSASALAEMIRLAAEGPCWDDGIEVLSATPSWVRLVARCDKNTADRLLQFFHEFVDLPETEREDVATAFREMLLNAIEYGGKFDPTQYLQISYVRARHMVMCRVKDPGEGFTLEEIQHAATANPPDDPIRHQAYRDARGLRPGGFGVLLTRNLVDEVIYGEKGNEVLLVKYLKSTTEARSNSRSAWLLLMLLLMASRSVWAQTAPQLGTLIINGSSGQAATVQIQGRTYVDVSALAHIASGSLSFQGSQIILNLPAANGNASASAAAPVPAQQSGLSRNFMKAGIEEIALMREWASPLANAIRNGYPVTEDWVANYRGPAADGLRMASVAASTDDDQSAFQLLNNEFQAIQKWSDRMVAARTNMDAAEYAVSPDALSDDPLSAKIMNCGHFLASMLGSGSFQDDASCH